MTDPLQQFLTVVLPALLGAWFLWQSSGLNRWLRGERAKQLSGISRVGAVGVASVGVLIAVINARGWRPYVPLVDHSISEATGLFSPDLKAPTLGAVLAIPLEKVFGAAAPESMPVEGLIGLENAQAAPEEKLRSASGGWWILDASKGVHSNHLEFVRKHFGDLHERSGEEKSSICWRRTPAFPLVTGNCQERLVRFIVDARPSDLARTAAGETTASLRRLGEINVVLVTHGGDFSVSGAAATQEEKCLGALSRRQACALVELLPGPSLFALSVVSNDPVGKQALEEFRLAHGSSVVRALTEFGTWSVPQPTDREFLQGTKWCPGLDLNSGAESKVEIANVGWLKAELVNVTSHDALLRTIRKFTDHVACPGMFQIELPKLNLNDPLPGARTFLQRLREEPVWLTTPSSYAYRANHIKNINLAYDANHRVLWLKSREKVEQLSVSIILPQGFPEELLMDVAAVGSAGGWRVNSMGTKAFRISFDEVSDVSWVDLDRIFIQLRDPQLKLSSVMASVGVMFSLLVSYLVAAALGLVQVSSPSASVRNRWFATFVSVFFICFVLIFVSFQNARKIAGGEASVVSIDNPLAPHHFFMHEWPETWFDKNLNLRTEKVTGLAQDEKAKLTVVRERAKFEIRPAASPKPVFVWEDIRARNFYFRRTTEFAALILGWQGIAANDRTRWKFLEQAQLRSNVLPNDAILIAPELAFISDDELKELEGFVERGGTLLFAFAVADDASLLEHSRLKGPLAEALRSVGMGTELVTSYSEIMEPGFTVDAITTRHLVSSSNGSMFGGSNWIRGRKYKSVNLVFLGVQPLDSRSQALTAAIVHRLQGDRLALSDVGEWCATSLLVKPFASEERLTKFVDEVKDVGIEARWLVDPNAFINLVPTWGSRFVRDGVAFMDDGTVEGRFVAQKYWSQFLEKYKLGKLPMVLVSERKPLPGMHGGPEVEMIPVRTVDLNSSDQERLVQVWFAECGAGLALPRVISNGRSSDLDRFVALLRASEFKSIQPRGFETYLRRSVLAETSSSIRVLKFRDDLPTQFEVGQK